MTTLWRWVETGALPAALNMAIDETLMASVRNAAPGMPRCVLRFYRWNPAALSLGYAQRDHSEVDFAACRRLGIDVVRRPTGGRAILHNAEVTYALIVPESTDALPQGVLASYRVISDAMVSGLAGLGLEAQLVPVKPDQAEAAEARAACFATPSRYEVAVGGRKLIGSAQWRKDGVILQHGSIPLLLEPATLFACLHFASEAARTRAQARFTANAVSVSEALQRPVTYVEVRDAVAAGLRRGLDMAVQPLELTAAEWAHAQELARCKYARLDWNRRKAAAPPEPATAELGRMRSAGQ